MCIDLARPLPINPTKMQAALRRWYAKAARDFPWRRKRDPYGIVVAEFMLQQTQAATVTPYYERWLATWPDFNALATASAEAVMGRWAGLGYYNRARHLHSLAKTIVARAALPQTVEEWRALPGVGPYTAAAIASQACGQPAAAVDGNVVRVLARLTKERRVWAGGAEARAHFQTLAETLLDRTRPGRHNEALMELGATVCQPRRPQCGACPWQRWCGAAQQGRPEEFPKMAPRSTVAKKIARLWVRQGATILLRKIPAQSRRLAGFYELPEPDGAEEEAIVARSEPVYRAHRAISRERIEESIFRLDAAALASAVLASQAERQWVEVAELERVPIPGPHRRWILLLLDRESGPGPVNPRG